MNPPQTDPTEILRYRDGLYAVELLAAAICGLDFFTWLEAHPSSAEEICTSLGIQARPTDVMLTLFAANGFVETRREKFHITKVASEFLSKASPWNLIPYYQAMDQRPVCKDMLTVLRTGKPAAWASYKDEQDWVKAMAGERFARMFTAAMDCRGLYLAHALAKTVDLSGCSRLLDIAGGSGVYARALAAANSHLSATVLEQPPVDQIARETAQERVEVQTGDMFKDPFPQGHDAHLFSNVLHDWDVPVVKELVRKSFAALPEGGLIMVHGAHLNAEKTGPLPVAEYSALLMNVSQGRCYSVAEIESYLGEAGFRDFTFQPTAADRSVITGRRCT